MTKLNPNAGEFVPCFGGSRKISSDITVKRYTVDFLLSLRDTNTYASTIRGVILPDIQTNPQAQKGAVERKFTVSTSLILNHIDKGRCRRSRQKSGASRKSSPLALPPKKTSGELEKEARDAMRRSNALLNKLSSDNFGAIRTQFSEIEVSGSLALHAIVGVIFDRAIAEPMFSFLYAQLCTLLSDSMPEFKDGSRTTNFRRILLTKCYEALVGGSEDQTDSAWRRQCMLGNVIFIGELFRRQLLTENIMHVCIAMMLDSDRIATVEMIEAVCRLLVLVGELLDASSPASRRTMDDYFEALRQAEVNNNELSERLRALISETIELRRNSWISASKKS